MCIPATTKVVRQTAKTVVSGQLTVCPTAAVLGIDATSFSKVSVQLLPTAHATNGLTQLLSKKAHLITIWTVDTLRLQTTVGFDDCAGHRQVIMTVTASPADSSSFNNEAHQTATFIGCSAKARQVV